jgi:DNA-binding NarL/FixJ family response regulator
MTRTHTGALLLSLALEREDDITVVAEFADAASAYAGLREQNFDIVVMDLNMPGGAALETLARLHRRHPGLASLVFSMYANASFARQAFAAGARGYVTKSSAPETLLRAVREIRAGPARSDAELSPKPIVAELSATSSVRLR